MNDTVPRGTSELDR
jgi:uncharacterized protein YkwD